MSNSKNDKNTSQHSLPDERGFWGRFFARFILFITRRCAKLRYVGTENIPDTIPYVLVPNHQTYMDGLLVADGLPKGHFKHLSAMIGADLITDYGLVGKLISLISRGIEVERHGNPVRGLVMACRACKAGNIMLVHPEGTRTHDGLVGPLLNGSAYIAQKCNVPLIPVYIEGGFEFYSRYDKLPRFRNPLTKKKFEINVIFGEAMYADKFSDAHAFTEAIADWLRAREKEYLQKNEGKLRDVDELKAKAAERKLS